MVQIHGRDARAPCHGRNWVCFALQLHASNLKLLLNWVCLAHLPCARPLSCPPDTPGPPGLALFSIIASSWVGRPRPTCSELALFRIIAPTSLDPGPLPAGKLGLFFVLHFTLQTSHLRLPQIGFVCTAVFKPTTDYRLPATVLWLSHVSSFRFQIVNMSFPRRRES
jgi:hypothetical protein